MKYELPKLPYNYNALEPVISEKIMTLHHTKHHASYVNGANLALEKLEKYRRGEIEIDVRAVLRDLSFNLNGHIMHSVFWPNMKPPEENNKPGGKIADLIQKTFGSFEAFQKEFNAAANSVEGSGWAALVFESNSKNLLVVQIEKHNLAHIGDSRLLLVLDVWEHAWYLDYPADRASYVKNWWKVVNWDNVEERLEKLL